MSPELIVQRCTRNGVTSWQNAALMMGCSVDSVRSRYDPSYMNARPWPHPCVEVKTPPEQEPIDENDMSSPYVKGPGMKARIAALLEHHMMSTEALAGALCTTTNSIRARLDRMLSDGRVFHDGGLPRSWGLTDQDGQPRVYSSGSVGVAIAGVAGICSGRGVTQAMARLEIVNGGRRQFRGAA